MLPEQLLQPRYKVIANYPQWPFSDESDEHKFIEGDIMLYLRVNGHMTYKRIGRCGWMSVGVPCIAHPEKYPKIFRKMEWWEERRIEDMPQYIKEVDSLYKIGEVIKVAEWEYCDDDMMWCFRDEKDNSFTWVRGFVPATESEYNAYLNTK